MQPYKPIDCIHKTFDDLYGFCQESIILSNNVDNNSLAKRRALLLKQLTTFFIQKVLAPVEALSSPDLKNTIRTFAVLNIDQVEKGFNLISEKLKNFPKEYIQNPPNTELTEELNEACKSFLRRHHPYEKQSFYGNKLPYELMKKCFSYLSIYDLARLSRVSHYFETLASEVKKSYNTLDLFHLSLRDNNFKYIIQQCPDLTELSFPPNFPSSFYLHYINYFSKLTKLHLKNHLLVKDDFFDTLNPSKTLNTLDLENTAISASRIKNRLAKLPNLTCLNLSYLPISNNDSIELINAINNCSKLISLNLEGNMGIISSSFSLFEMNSHLKFLNLSKTTVQRDFLEKLELIFPNLISINLMHCSQFKERDLETLNNMKSLQKIGAYGINFDSIVSPVSRKQIIATDNLGNIFEADLQLFLQVLNFSRFLDFEFHSNIQNPRLISADYLNHIDFSLSNIQDQDVKFLKQLPNLEILQFNRCQKLTDEACSYLAQCKKLVYLNLHGCDKLSNQALENLSVSPSLEELDLSWCENLTDYSSLSKLSKLHSLYLKNCSQLDDQIISTLENLSYLNVLVLQQPHLNENFPTFKITNKSLESISKLCYLKIMGLINFPQLEPQSLSNSFQVNPNLIIISADSIYTIKEDLKIMLHSPRIRQSEKMLTRRFFKY
ncbi:MAG: hypothetical protein K0S74_1394 [Chlamydiales bacterium]|jgi:hypothetical protein|nr:hypothetical protein [Chlamydiales bacterium]